jgi:uncharacterized protein
MELVDSLRGYALLGLFLVHMVERFELYWLDPAGGPVVAWTFGLFAGKAFALFALCFGLSFFILMDRAAARGVDFSGRFVWRLLLLLGFGLLHSLYYRGDILVFLALLGLALIPFNRIRDNRVLLALGVVILLQPYLWLKLAAALSGADWANQPPAFTTSTSLEPMANGGFMEALHAQAGDGRVSTWSFMYESGRLAQIAGLFLVGLVLGRSGFFADPDRFRAARRAVLAVAALAWAALPYGRPALLAILPAESRAAGVAGFIVDAWAALALLSVQVVLFVELYQSFGGPLLRLLAPAGRMTLTLYLGQSLVFVPVFFGWGLGLHDRMSSGQALLLGLAAFAAQVAFAHLWFRAFQYGPLEWLWRALTYLTWKVPFRRTAPAAA